MNGWRPFRVVYVRTQSHAYNATKLCHDAPLEQVKSYDIFSEVGYYIFVVVCGGACRVGWPLVALRLAQLAVGPVVVATRPHEQFAVLQILLVLSTR